MNLTQASPILYDNSLLVCIRDDTGTDGLVHFCMRHFCVFVMILVLTGNTCIFYGFDVYDTSSDTGIGRKTSTSWGISRD